MSNKDQGRAAEGGSEPWRPTVLGQSVAGGDTVGVGDHHRVFAQVVFVRVGEGQSGTEEGTQPLLESTCGRGLNCPSTRGQEVQVPRKCLGVMVLLDLCVR